MQGKILKVFNNDINGKEDDREILLFAIFNHKKYMNKYAVFIIKDKTGPNKLCCGSIFLKENEIVIFNIKTELTKIILDFLEEFKTNNYNEFELLDTSNLEKVELINYNEIDYNDINIIYSISFPAPIKNEKQSKKRKPKWLAFLIIILLVIAILCYLTFFVKIKETILECSIKKYNYDINTEYLITKKILFDKSSLVKNISVTETHKFSNYDEYNRFKNDNKQYDYFDIKGSYKYIDEELSLKVFYEEDTVERKYEQIKSILEKEGYTCKEEYDE